VEKQSLTQQYFVIDSQIKNNNPESSYFNTLSKQQQQQQPKPVFRSTIHITLDPL
jgi:hypothetical protein